ncbi:MAG: ribonuclease III [Deltaproteobacteria bacterium]|nr:ribonuclease III [Deltaproteobacteria bacterium]
MPERAGFGKKLGYRFRDLKWLELALIHKSFGNENRGDIAIDERDNERLEFLGDAVLDLVISEILLSEYRDWSEGELSKMRASLVNERVLASLARDLGLGSLLKLGKGEEQTGGRDKDSILASTLEAVIAAIYMDAGYKAARTWVQASFLSRLRRAPADESYGDFKTRLQEIVQARFKSAPRYELIQTEGPDHDKTFEVRLIVDGKAVASASGKSKKEAEQNAARAALANLIEDSE